MIGVADRRPVKRVRYPANVRRPSDGRPHPGQIEAGKGGLMAARKALEVGTDRKKEQFR